MNAQPKEKPNISLNIACYVLALIGSIITMYGLMLPMVILGIAIFLLGKSKRAKSAGLSLSLGAGTLVLLIVLWPLFRIIAPKYFNEGYPHNTGAVTSKPATNTSSP